VLPLIGYLLRHFRPVFTLAVCTGFVSGFSGIGLIYVISLALHAGGAPIAETVIWLFVGLCVALFLGRVSTNLLLARLGQATVFKLRMELARQILRTPLHRLQEAGSGRLYALLTDDVASIASACELLPLLLINFAIVVCCLGYLGWLSWQVLALVGGMVGIGVLSFRLAQRKALGSLRAAREQNDVLFGHMRGLTEGIKELKLRREGRRSFVADSVDATATAYRNHYLAGMSLYVVASNWGNGLFYVAVGLILFVLPQWLRLPADVLTGSVLAIIYMMAPLAVIMNNLPVLGRAGIALGKIAEFGRALALHGRDDEKGEALGRPAAGRLQFQGVSHRYRRDNDERSFSLGPLDLTLQPGELVFLVGGNGSGKTTLALLLVGLYVPEQGAILLDGRAVGDAERDDYRQHFSAVFADFYLFDSLLGFENRELDGKAREYLRQLQLDHKVKIEDGRFSTLELSQGQRKRLALLVAYLEDRPFYVFDEWAADQDPLFKNIFYTEILPSLKARGKTVVVITHDDGYFHLADRCLRLEDGKLSELAVPRQAEVRSVAEPAAVPEEQPYALAG
jgi:putative ATP-binding cassette transporter